jgi:hypothetical protein
MILLDIYCNNDISWETLGINFKIFNRCIQINTFYMI